MFLLIRRVASEISLFSEGISSRYFPFPEKFSFHRVTSITFVDFMSSSSHIARKGLQKKECIDNVFFLLKTKSKGGEVLRNISPLNLEKTVSHTLTSIECLFPSRM